jgi:hypothetical protein
MDPLFAIWSHFGPAIMTVVFLVGSIIVGGYVLAYTANCLLTVVDQTAAGADEVIWPDEPTVDWLTRSVYLGILLAIWLAPAGILSRVLRDDLFPGEPGLRLLVLAIPGLWLLFPIGLLSSRSAVSRITVFRPEIVSAMARVGLGTLGFYLLTGILAAVVMPVVYLGLFSKGAKPLLLLAGPLVAAGLLIYARLIGRLGLLIRRLNPPNEKPGDRPRKKKKAPREEPREEEPEMLEVADRSDEDDEWSGGSYAMSREAAARTPKYVPPSEDDFNEMGPKIPQAVPDPEPVVAPRQFDDEDEEWSGGSYGMREEPKAPTSEQIQTSAEPRKPAPKPKRPRKAPPAPVGPRYPLLQGVFTFPWYGHSFGAWLWLAIGLTILGVLVGACIAFYPSDGDASLRLPPLALCQHWASHDHVVAIVGIDKGCCVPLRMGQRQ